ncbi:Endoglucanase A-like protein [Hapsidospora chrysogenum ATCC 11550]|uniref:Endoglucanase A-like protein n=1 Tax=Hapsidospora chrysogenum (strain ATCC 11550 / CBS 779.69 / DSM 880 / IAM 14645 / JCM 23072 / IMI 49137) TaxID=857340 RepID=A0A086SU85_HAPC1|nr:Endoglucanase A-like protein [Hapsidospora chrysogenum ATCC 11550]
MKSTLLFSVLAPLALAQTLCGQFDYHASGGYYVNNNEWGADSGQGEQCTTIREISSNGVKWYSEWTWSGGEYNVKSYPYSGRELTDKKLVSQINGIPNKAEWGYKGDQIRANVAYDLFTAEDPNHPVSGGDYELMIW